MLIAEIFTNLQTAVQNSSGGILANSLSLGNDIFSIVFITFIVWGLCKCAIAQDFNMFWWNMGSVFFKMIPPLAALHFSQLILPNMQSITNYFVGRITGTTSNSAMSLSGLGDTVSTALFQYAKAPIANPLAAAITLVSNPTNVPLVLFNEGIACIVSLVVKFCFAWVSVELVLAWYQVLTSSAIGAASVGFFGSDATSDMAFRYTSGVISGMWKVIFLSVWPTTVVKAFQSFSFTVDLANPSLFVMTSVNITAFALVVLVATFRIVRMADGMFTGQSTFSLQDITSAVSGAVRSVIKSVKK